MLNSHVIGDKDVVLCEETVGDLFDRIATTHGSREALVVKHQNIRWTYGELAKEVDALAAGLHALGLTSGDRLGIWAPNCAEWTVTQFATAKLGIILVNINPAYRLSELEYALNKVECRAIITAESFKTSNYVQMLQKLAPELASAAPGKLSAAKIPSLEFVIKLGSDALPGFYTYRDVTALATSELSQEVAHIQVGLSTHDPINIQFTSGTTGMPKGATLSHYSIVNNGFFCGSAMQFTEEDKLCIPVPLYHCFGMVLGDLACVTHGACMVYPNDGFDPLLTLQVSAEERCTALHGVPTMFIAMLDHPEFNTFDLSSLRTGVMAGSPCPIEVMKRVIGEMHMAGVTIGYGMTETAPLSFQSSVSDSVEKRVSTVGRVLPQTEVRIVDEDGNNVPVGATGELITSGYCVMKGYWNDEEKTAEAVRDGWMHTGDLATFDSEGYCQIVGRLKDMLIRGGENIYPREIEEFLYTHPDIQDVQVFGVPDEKYGEEVCAWIILKEGTNCNADAVMAFCKDKIAHYKVPRYIHFVEEFPMTVTGKAQKFIMREQMEAILKP
ncbi:MAG: AMP-binding protein [Kordiimonas sp.]